MHFWTAPGPELIRVYTYLASCRFPMVFRALWKGLTRADEPMVRSSPKSKSAQLRRIEMHATGDLRLPVSRRLVIAFPGIEFAGVRQRSGQFSCPLSSHEPVCFRPSFCASRLFAVGWLAATSEGARPTAWWPRRLPGCGRQMPGAGPPSVRKEACGAPGGVGSLREAGAVGRQPVLRQRQRTGGRGARRHSGCWPFRIVQAGEPGLWIRCGGSADSPQARPADGEHGQDLDC